MSTGGQGGRPPQEIELRLTAAPEVLDALEGDPLLESGATGPVKRKHQIGTYYDTADRRLQRRGVNFRVRRVSGAFVQTVKASSKAAPLSRAEWEADIRGPEPDLEAVAATGAAEATGVLLPGDLQPLFVTDVRRTVRTLAYDPGGKNGALIEVAVDRGRVHLPGAEGDGPSTPISEMELELRAGPAAALFDLALALNERHALRVGFAGKAARGYALLSGERPKPRKSDPLVMDRSWTVDECIGHVFRSCFVHWTANEKPAELGDDPEGVHQMRVALRRLRSALSLFAPALPAEQSDWLGREAKWLANSLGQARDWDVFLGEMLPGIHGGDFDGLLTPLEKAAEARRRAGYRRVRQAIGSPRCTRFLLELWRWIEDRAWRSPALAPALNQPIAELACAVLARQHARAVKRGKGFARLDLPDRHRVRIAIKKLRYSVEFFASLYGEAASKPYRKRLSRLQDALGALNDSAIVHGLMDEVLSGKAGGEEASELALAAGIANGWYTRGRLDNDAALVETWAAFTEAKPFWRNHR